MARVYTAIVNEQFRTNDGPDTRSNEYTVVRFFTTFSPPPHEKWHAMGAEAGRCDQPQTRRLVQNRHRHKGPDIGSIDPQSWSEPRDDLSQPAGRSRGGLAPRRSPPGGRGDSHLAALPADAATFPSPPRPAPLILPAPL